MDHAEAPPTCARCGSDCELIRDEGGLRRWDCLQCWAYVVIPRTHPAWVVGVAADEARSAWANAGVVPILAVPAAPLDSDELNDSRSTARRRGDPG